MDIRKIKKLIDLIQESDVSEIEISEGEESVRISRNQHSAAISYSTPAPTHYAAPAPAPAAPAAAPAVAETSSAVNEANAVRSPMVGTFYRSSSPEAASFVEVGQSAR